MAGIHHKPLILALTGAVALMGGAWLCVDRALSTNPGQVQPAGTPEFGVTRRAGSNVDPGMGPIERNASMPRSAAGLGAEATPDGTPEPGESLPRLWVHDLELLERYKAAFLATPERQQAETLVTQYMVAWSDMNGRSVAHVPGTKPARSLDNTEDEAWIWRADEFGDRIVWYAKADFPELLELQRIEREKEPFTTAVVPKELADLVTARAEEFALRLKNRR